MNELITVGAGQEVTFNFPEGGTITVSLDTTKMTDRLVIRSETELRIKPITEKQIDLTLN